MTPNDIFQNMIEMFPKAWDAGQQKQFAKLYNLTLAGIEPDILKKAYEKTIKELKFNKPPMPAEIKSNIEARTAPVEDSPVPTQWPYRQEAHTELSSNPRAQLAVKEGWGLGLWEFIAKNNRYPNSSEQAHLIETNDLFHKMYTVCGKGIKIEMPTSDGPQMLEVPGDLQGMFDLQMQKREKIVEKYQR